MKVSTLFELLLVFLIIALAASRFTGQKNGITWKSPLQGKMAADKDARKDRQTTPNRYCSCSNLTCNCCRDFSLPVVPVSGPGCASLKYVQGDSMLVTMSFGDRVLRNVTISGKKPKPICMNMPGGISKFCGRVYGISRDGDQIRACLGLELRALDDVEAALRVSCFKLGPNGVNVEPGKPVPTDEDDDDDDEDDDDFGLPGDDDDEDDEEEEDDDDDDVFSLGDDDESENTVESSEDYGGFSALSDEFLESFFESDSSKKKKKPVSTAIKPQVSTASVKPAVTPIVISTTGSPAKTIKPGRVVTTRLVYSTPAKVASIEKVAMATPQYEPPVKLFSTTNPYTSALVNKVYISPLQYKPTEKVHPSSVNQPLESYVPAIAQVATEKVYTSPQQISTDKVVYMSTINQYNKETQQMTQPQPSESYSQTLPAHTTVIKKQSIGNLYVPTTQQFASTERIFLPENISSPTTSSLIEQTAEFEPVTSTSMSINVVQSAQQENTIKDKGTAEKSVTEMTLDTEYNEVDSDIKTTTLDARFELNTFTSMPIAMKLNKLTTEFPEAASVIQSAIPSTNTEKSTVQTEKNNNSKDKDLQSNTLDEVDGTMESVLGDTNSENSKQNSTSEDSELLDDVDDSSYENSEEGGLTIGTQDHQPNDNDDEEVNEEEEDDSDDEDDEFRKFAASPWKEIEQNFSSTTPAPVSKTVHNGREHKRMKLPAVFSQKPEVSSFWSSGGHLYKLRMSPMALEQSPPGSMSINNRLARLNLILPVLDTHTITTGHPTLQAVSSTTQSNTFVPLHRFKLTDRYQKNDTDRSRRNRKFLRFEESTPEHSKSRPISI